LGSSIRKVDVLGRVVIPKHIREECEIGYGDELEFIESSKGFYVQKFNKHAKCAVTGKATDDLKLYAGIVLSDEGVKILKEKFKNEDD
jgi:AbrB family looped-hinge helix DNA binding protein